LLQFTQWFFILFYLAFSFFSTCASSTVFPPVFLLLLDHKLMIHILAT
jgi:hypothetical protein